MDRKKAIRDHYEPRIAPGKASYEILDWSDAVSQQARFHVLVEDVDLVGKTLLDVGCGLGDLWAFLKDRGIGVDYTGVDILEKMVALARSRHPEARFQCADVFSEDPFGARRFDVVFCSGTFNLDLGNSREFLAEALARLFGLARQFLVFNLLHARTKDKFEHCVYYDPAEVLPMLRKFPCHVRLVEDYLPNDFTVICKVDPPGQSGP
jgi:SAM-dependent methyltransferase